MVAAVSSGLVSHISSQRWHQSCISWSVILPYGQGYPTRTLSQEVLFPMARGLFIALLSLLLLTVSCTQSSLVLRPDDASHPEESSQITATPTEDTSDPSKAAPSKTTNAEEENVLAASPAQEESSANGQSPAEVDSEEEPYTDQKRVDDALYYYQEALEYWNSGEPDRAILSLDQSYQIFSAFKTRTTRRSPSKKKTFVSSSLNGFWRFMPPEPTSKWTTAGKCR